MYFLRQFKETTKDEKHAVYIAKRLNEYQIWQIKVCFILIKLLLLFDLLTLSRIQYLNKFYSFFLSILY